MAANKPKAAKRKNPGRPKYDYTSEEFLSSLETYAKKGLTDKEIAYAIGLNPVYFCDLKKKHTELAEVLARGRARVITALRTKYFAMAMGGIKTKNRSVVTRHIKLEDGTLTKDDEVQVTETEIELPPSLQAQATLLYHYDEDWRKVERKQDEDASDIPTDISKGINIDEWIKDRIK